MEAVFHIIAMGDVDMKRCCIDWMAAQRLGNLDCDSMTRMIPNLGLVEFGTARQRGITAIKDRAKLRLVTPRIIPRGLRQSI